MPRVLQSPGPENGTSNREDPSKIELDSIPVHASRDGTDDARGMAKGFPENGYANPFPVHVGVVTRGQSLTVADEAAVTSPPVPNEQTVRAPNTNSATIIPSALPHAFWIN